MNHAIKSRNYQVVPQKTKHLFLPALHYKQAGSAKGIVLRSVSVDTNDEDRPAADREICCCPCVGHCLRYDISSETEI